MDLPHISRVGSLQPYYARGHVLNLPVVDSMPRRLSTSPTSRYRYARGARESPGRGAKIAFHCSLRTWYDRDVIQLTSVLLVAMANYTRGPAKNPAVTEKRRKNMKKANAQRLQNSAARRAAREQGLPDPFPRIKPTAGKRFTFDDVVTAVLEADDAVESKRIIDAMRRKASMGDVKAAQFLIERSLGKPLQKVQLSGGLTLETMDAALPGVPEATGDVDPLSAN